MSTGGGEEHTPPSAAAVFFLGGMVGSLLVALETGIGCWFGVGSWMV